MKNDQESGLLRLYKERLESAKDYERNLRSIVEAAHDMAGSKDIADIMESMLELTVKITGSQFAGAALMGRHNEVFFSSRAPVKDPGIFPVDSAFNRSAGLSGLLMRTKQHYICNITDGNEYLNDDVRTDYGIKNYISVPILAKNRSFFGLMEAYNKESFEPFNDNDADILNTLASFTAVAVEKFRVYVEFGKFGDEVQKIVDETLEAEGAFIKECGKLNSARKEIENLKKNTKKAKILALDIAGSNIDEVLVLKEKAIEIIKALDHEQS